ncbi:MAG: universal stress protein [Halioglobus sp.]|jgi:nucleotide-binding universal stress UspA family protein
MYHSIVVGQDNSEFSRRALGLAIWLARVTRGRLHLLHLHSRKPHIRPKTSLDKIHSVMQARLEECQNEGIAGDCRIVKGWTTQALVNESKWHDLVVVGRHGESWRERTRGIGSLPTTLLGASPVPVLIAADSPVFPDQILVAFDDSLDACMALRIAASLALERKLRVHVVETLASHRGRDHLSRARAYLEDWKEIKADFEVLTGKVSDEIVAYIERHRIPLTFLPALDRSLFGRKLTTRIAVETGSSLIVPNGRSPQIY